MSGESNSSFGDWTILVDIVSWNNLIFTLSEAIVNMLGDLEGFILERCEINGIGLRFRELELFDKIISKTSKSEPGILSERSLRVLVVLVNHVIPDGMKFTCGVVVLKDERITTFVTSWVLIGVSVTAVERLMNISHVVDNESESKGLGFFVAAVDSRQFADGLVSDCVGGIFALEPLVDCWHSHGDVLDIVCNLHLGGITTFSDDRSIIKVPVRLPTTTSSFVVISKGDALNEWIIFLMFFSEKVAVF